MTSRLALAVIAFMLLVVGACSSAKPPTSVYNSPHPSSLAGNIINMPSGFSDVAVACDGHNRVFVTYDDVNATSAIAVISDPVKCP